MTTLHTVPDIATWWNKGNDGGGGGMGSLGVRCIGRVSDDQLLSQRVDLHWGDMRVSHLTLGMVMSTAWLLLTLLVTVLPTALPIALPLG